MELFILRRLLNHIDWIHPGTHDTVMAAIPRRATPAQLLAIFHTILTVLSAFIPGGNFVQELLAALNALFPPPPPPPSPPQPIPPLPV